VRSAFSLLGVADGTPLSAGFPAAVWTLANASCVVSFGDAAARNQTSPSNNSLSGYA
jgi:hypothetical protein